jgi:hypothetical protein
MHSQEKKGTCTTIHQELVKKLVRLPADSGFRRNGGIKKVYQSGAAKTEVGNPTYLAPRRSWFFPATMSFPQGIYPPIISLQRIAFPGFSAYI